MPVQRETVERVLRGGIGSSLVHGALALLLLIGSRADRSRTTAFAPPLPVVQVAATPADAGPHRDPDLPFRDEPDQSGQIPLSLDNGPSGANFNIDLARIRERRNDLFPFVTWDLSFLRRRPGDERAGMLEFETGVAPIDPAGGPLLRLPPGERQAIVDRAWSRRYRWSNLDEIVRLSDRYNPNEGDLPAVVREYVEQNIPQPYEDWSDPDPVYWITLMLAADDAPLVEFVARYLRRYPASRVSTELLFLLDASAESSCDVLQRVLRAGTSDLPLAVTQLDSPEAFELATALASGYRSWIFRHKADVPQRCVSARIAVLRRIIDTSPDGYGVADAKFRLGQLLWTTDRRAEAVEWWAGMQPDERLQYAPARRAILGALADGAPDHNPSRISSILLDDERRWRIAAGDRLDHFGVSASEF